MHATQCTPLPAVTSSSLDTSSYEAQLSAKLSKLKVLFEDMAMPDVEVHRGPASNYRMRAEFNMRGTKAGLDERPHYIMFAQPSTSELPAADGNGTDAATATDKDAEAAPLEGEESAPGAIGDAEGEESARGVVGDAEGEEAAAGSSGAEDSDGDGNGKGPSPLTAGGKTGKRRKSKLPKKDKVGCSATQQKTEPHMLLPLSTTARTPAHLGGRPLPHSPQHIHVPL